MQTRENAVALTTWTSGRNQEKPEPFGLDTAAKHASPAFARGLGFRPLQIPVHDGRMLDLARGEDDDYLQAIETLRADHGLVISELAAQ